MDAHTHVLRMSAEEFTKLLAGLNQAFVADRAAIVWSEEGSAHEVNVFDDGEIDRTTLSELREFAASVDQLLVFAFSDAPESVVEDWGDEHGDGLGKIAVERSRALADDAPDLRNEWSIRFDGIGNVLGAVETRMVYSFESSDFRLMLHLGAFQARGVRKVPVAASRQHVEVALSRRELRRLIDLLQSAEASMPKPEDLLSGESGEDKND